MTLEELHVARARLDGIVTSQRQHLVGHVQADGSAARPDAPGADQDVGSGSGAQVEDGLALLKICGSRGDAAAEGGGHRIVRGPPGLIAAV